MSLGARGLTNPLSGAFTRNTNALHALPLANAARRTYHPHAKSRVSRYGSEQLKPMEVVNDMRGQQIIHDPLYNKGIAFTARERDRFALRGLLPARVMTIEEQVTRAYAGFKRAGQHGRNTYITPSITQEQADKHVYLTALHDRNEVLFYRLLFDNIKEMAPIVYTPVVGYACQHHGELWRRSRGIWINGYEDREDMHAIMQNWPAEDVDVIVVTDGSRVLGLGDLGAYGMGIPIGKLMTYVAGSGIHPARTLPMFVDVGTDNQDLINDPLYLGVKKPRMTGSEYLAVWDEIIDAITYRYPKALIQFEDIRTPYAETLLTRYRRYNTCFNDDIQGTGSMVVGGILAALRLKGMQPSDIAKERVLCVGAGSAGLGVCSSIRRAMKQEGVPQEHTYTRFWITDKDGIITTKRKTATSLQQNYARNVALDVEMLAKDDAFAHDREAGCNFEIEEGMDLAEIIRRVKPTILLGLSGVGNIFNQEVVEAMTESLEGIQRPVIFALSNPTDKAECTARQAYEWSKGKAIYASGSPFDPVVIDGKEVMRPSQGNNIFIYPGIGLGVTATKATGVTDEMLYEASKALAASVPAYDLQQGRLFPEIDNIREVSHQVACAVARKAREQGLATEDLPPFKESWEQYIKDLMWTPNYQPLI